MFVVLVVIGGCSQIKAGLTSQTKELADCGYITGIGSGIPDSVIVEKNLILFVPSKSVDVHPHYYRCPTGEGLCAPLINITLSNGNSYFVQKDNVFRLPKFDVHPWEVVTLAITRNGYTFIKDYSYENLTYCHNNLYLELADLNMSWDER